jgi:hypothetical protein
MRSCLVVPLLSVLGEHFTLIRVALFVVQQFMHHVLLMLLWGRIILLAIFIVPFSVFAMTMMTALKMLLSKPSVRLFWPITRWL